MDWKEAAKWIGILVAAGLISTAIELMLEWRVFGPAAQAAARADARAEVDRIMTAAIKKAQARSAPMVAPPPTYVPPTYVPSQAEVITI